MFGYKSLEEYYADANPATKIDRIGIPLLCLNAADDPFVPLECEFPSYLYIHFIDQFND